MFLQARRATITTKLGLYQTTKFFHNEEKHQQNEKQLSEWQNISANATSNKSSISKMHSKLIQFNTKKSN